MLDKFLKTVNQHNCIAITGLAKNTGKTCVLNTILNDGNPKIRGVTSIGYDGENTDQVTGTAKPTIYVKKGTLIATADGLLSKCDITRELLSYTGFNTPMGEVIIIKALSDGYVQLAGPSTRSQMEAIVKMLQNYGVEQIFIDGAASRKSTAAIAFSDACILATGAAFSHNPEKIIEETVHFTRLLSLPAYPVSDYTKIKHINTLDNDALTQYTKELATNLSQTDSANVFFEGAINAEFIKQLLNISKLPKLSIIAEDGTRYLFNSQLFDQLTRRGIKLFVKNHINLIAITVNPTSPNGTILDSDYLCKEINEYIDIPTFNPKRY